MARLLSVTDMYHKRNGTGEMNRISQGVEAKLHHYSHGQHGLVRIVLRRYRRRTCTTEGKAEEIFGFKKMGITMSLYSVPYDRP